MLRRAGQGARSAVGHSLRVLHLLAELALGAVLLAGLGFGGLAWRLSYGPVHLGFLARRIEAAANEGHVARLSIGDVALAWEGWRLGVDRPVDFRLTDVRFTDPSGARLADLPRAELSLSLGRLLLGEIVPRAIELDGAQLRGERDADGSAALDLGQMSEAGEGSAPKTPIPSAQRPLARLLAALARPAQSDRETPDRSHYSQLRRLLIRDARLVMRDQPLGATWRASGVEVDLRRQPAGGVSGNAAATLHLGGSKARLTAEASLDAGGAETHIEARVSPVRPAALAGAAPRLAPLAVLDAPLALAASLDFGRQLALREWTLQADLGQGTARLPQGGVGIEGGALRARGGMGALVLQRLSLTLSSPGGGRPTTIAAHGTATRAQGRVEASAELTADVLDFADLGRLWPEGVGGGARPWITGNITAGLAHDAAASFSVQGADDLSDLVLTSLSGHAAAEDLTVHWLRPVPPIEHGSASVTLEGPDSIAIALSGGRQGGITLRGGEVRISGLAGRHQVAAIDGELAGGLPEAIALLRHPRLGLLDRHPVPLNDPAGSFEAHLAVRLPLEASVSIEQVDIHARGQLHDVHLSAVALGKDLDEGTLGFQVSNDGLGMEGTADLAGVPARLGITMDFRGGPPTQVLQQVEMHADADEKALGDAGLNAFGVIAGPGSFDVTYLSRRSGQGEIDLRADLTRAALDGRALGWSKPAGARASATARVLLNHDRVTGIEDLHADGPGLLIAGRTQYVGGRPALLHLDRVRLGRTDIAGTVAFPARASESVRASLHGPMLDLSAPLSRHASPTGAPAGLSSGTGEAAPGMPWAVSAQIEHTLLAEGRVIDGVTAEAESDGRVVRRAHLASTGGEQIEATLVPEGAGRHLTGRAADAGALLRALDVLDTMDGGRMTVDARYDDTAPQHPLTGRAEITNFRLREAPAIVGVLRGMTLYGLVDAARGPGIGVTRLVAPFRLRGDMLELNDARAFSASLGVTAKGRVDLGRGTADIEGTIVPAYFFNSILGEVPLLGRLFSPERGGGVFAATYGVHGALHEPRVSVNPLAALTPGFTRGLFGMFP